MVQPASEPAARALRFYQEQGSLNTAFTGIRLLGQTILPKPYSERFRYRTELFQKSLFSGSDHTLPFTRRLKLAITGFDERQYFAYGFDQGANPMPYLSEYARNCAKAINPSPELLDNKARFDTYLHENGLGHYRPPRLGMIEDGRFVSPSDEAFRSILARNDRLVVKECWGGGGNTVHICESHPDGMTVNDDPTPITDVTGYLADLDRSIVSEYVHQAAYLDHLYPGAPNTLRILVMAPDDGKAFIPAAVQRIGSRQTGGFDNFGQGGLSARVMLSNGKLSRAAQIDQDHRVHWHSTHPDTGAQIKGVKIPKWDLVKSQVLGITRRLPEITYVGWDLLVTEPGEFVILEGNHFPNPRLIQVHQPLLRDGRVREFFVENEIPISHPTN